MKDRVGRLIGVRRRSFDCWFSHPRIIARRESLKKAGFKVAHYQKEMFLYFHLLFFVWLFDSMARLSRSNREVLFLAISLCANMRLAAMGSYPPRFPEVCRLRFEFSPVVATFVRAGSRPLFPLKIHPSFAVRYPQIGDFVKCFTKHLPPCAMADSVAKSFYNF